MVGESVESEVTLKSTGNITVRTVLECKSAFKEEKVPMVELCASLPTQHQLVLVIMAQL